MTYHAFVREVVRPHLEEEFVLFEHSPNLRIHAAGAKSLTSPHRDVDHMHSPWEVNFWVPLTPARDGASLWTESSPGRGDFHPFEVDYGQAVRFYGNQCMHFTKDNDTDGSRVSLDFRVVRLRDFMRSGIPLCGQEGSERWTLFSFYDVMGPDGIIGPKGWAAVAERAKGVELAAERPSLPVAAQVEVRSARSRSSSAEHARRCVKTFGSARAARGRCPRCGWIAARSKLLRELVYTDATGAQVPWLVESSAAAGEAWGLGCQPCRSARRRGVDVPETALTLFRFGVGTPGLLCAPLFRHGNHSKWQPREVDGPAVLLDRDGGHDRAVKAMTQP